MTLDVATLTLAKGEHTSFDDGACLLEAASHLAGEKWSDKPVCVSPVLGAYGRGLNDVLPDDLRQQLKVYLPRLLNTAGDGQDERRSYLALDWLVRVYTPTWLRLVPALQDQAALLESADEVVDLDTAAKVGAVVREAAAQAAAARAAAARAAAAWAASGAASAGAASGAASWAAAGAASGAASWAASWDASWDAARAASWAASGAASWAASWAASGAASWAASRDASRDASWDAVSPTVLTLQLSAIALMDRLIDPSA